MTQQLLNIGTSPNSGTGDNLRTMGTKVNANFTELYNNQAAESEPLLLGGVNWDTLRHVGASQNYSATGDVGFLPPGASLITQASTSISAGDEVGYGFYPELIKGALPGETLSGTISVGTDVYTLTLEVDKVPESDAYAFLDVLDTAVSTTVASGEFTPVGFNSHAPLYVDSSTSSQVELRINDGSWVNITSITDLESAKDEDLYVNVNDILEVRHLSAAAPEVATVTILAIGEPEIMFQFLTYTAATGILQPAVTSPAGEEDEVLIQPTVTASTYTANNHAESHAVTDWQVSEYSDFSVIFEESLDDAVNLVSWTPATLATGGSYYVRARYKSATYTSDWTDTVHFVTADTKVLRPDGVTPANSATGVATSPTLTSSAFAVSGAAQTHAQSQWQITLADHDWNAAAVDHTSAVDLVSYAASGLASTTLYKWRVRHQGGTTGWSRWSQALIFETV